MSICENVTANTDYETNTIGFIDSFDYMNKLYYKKIGETDENIDDKFSAFNSITSMKNLPTDILKTKIVKVKESFDKNNKNVHEKIQKLRDVLTVLDETLPYYEKQVENIRKILRNKVFINDVEIIRKKSVNAALTPEENMSPADYLTTDEKRKFSYYSTLKNQLYQLENIVIGSSKNIMVNEIKRANDMIKIRQAFGIITDDLKTKYASNITLSENQGKVVDKMMDLWEDEEITKIIADIDLDFDRNTDITISGLKGKVARALMNFTGMKYKQVMVIMSDKNFRKKMFKNANIEDIRNKMTSLKEMSLEYKQIEKFISHYNNKIHACPYCSFVSIVPITTALHIVGTHEKLINKYDFNQSLKIVIPLTTEDGYSTIYTNKVFKTIGEAYKYIKSVYLAPKLAEDIVEKIMYTKSFDRRIDGGLKLLPGYNVGVGLSDEFRNRYETAEESVIAFREQNPREMIKNRLVSMVNIQKIKEDLRRDLEIQYDTFLKNNLISQIEYDTVIKHIIKSEISKINDSGVKYNGKSFSKSRIQGSKNITKKHISRVILEKIMNKETGYTPMTNVSEMLEKLFGEDIQTIVIFEKMMNNFINYETNKPLEYIRKMMNNLVDFQVYMSGINLENAQEKIRNILFKDFESMKFHLSKKSTKELSTSQKDRYASLLRSRGLSQEEIDIELKQARTHIQFSTKEVVPDSEFNILNYTMVLLYAGLSDDEINEKLAEVRKEVSIDLIITEVTNLLMTVDGETTDVYNNMISTFSSVDTVKMNQYKKQFNSIFDLLMDMYNRDLHSFDLNRMNTKKEYSDRHREMTLGLFASIMSHYMKKMMGTNKMKTYVSNTLKMTPFYLTEESKFLKMAKIEKVIPAEKLKIKMTEVDNVDILLNNFMELDDDEDIEDEDSEIMELFDDDE